MDSTIIPTEQYTSGTLKQTLQLNERGVISGETPRNGTYSENSPAHYNSSDLFLIQENDSYTNSFSHTARRTLKYKAASHDFQNHVIPCQSKPHSYSPQVLVHSLIHHSSTATGSQQDFRVLTKLRCKNVMHCLNKQ